MAFIRPILEYGDVVWGNCTKENSELLEKGLELTLLKVSYIVNLAGKPYNLEGINISLFYSTK